MRSMLCTGNRGRDTVESAREGKLGVQMGRSMLEALKRVDGPLNDFVDVKCGKPMKLDSLGWECSVTISTLS